jgi:hypothetical protein
LTGGHMRTCKCGNAIPNTKTINNKRRNLRNRTKCLDCLPFGESRYRQKTPEEKKKYNAKKARNWYHRQKAKNGIDPICALRTGKKEKLVKIFGGCCQLCGYNKTLRNLAFHHLRDKKFPLSSRAFQFAWKKILKEAKKCVLVCHNCHGEIHDGLVEAEVIDKLHENVMCLLED